MYYIELLYIILFSLLFFLIVLGNPMPEVTWWQDERMIDRHVEVRQYSDQGVASNVLQLERLARKDLRTKVSCHASNTLFTQQPLTKSVEIELNREYNTKNSYFFFWFFSVSSEQNVFLRKLILR